MNRRAGFTLIELMAVLVLLCVLAGLVMFAAPRSTATARIRGAAIQVEDQIRRAQFWSRTHHASSWIQFGAQGEVRVAHGGVREPDWIRMDGMQWHWESTSGSNPRMTRQRILPAGIGLPWKLGIGSGAECRWFRFNGVSASLEPVSDDRHGNAES